MTEMRIAVISDIHGNIHALRAVLEDVRARNADEVWCAGDLVGYLPFPDEVIDTIRSAGIPTVMGNYDDGVAFDRIQCGCDYPNERAMELGLRSLSWTKEHVTDENKRFLSGLPKEIRREVDGKLVINAGSVGKPKHGSPDATYALVDFCEDGKTRVEFIEVPYDYEAAAKAIVDAGLPEEFAELIRTGKG